MSTLKLLLWTREIDKVDLAWPFSFLFFVVFKLLVCSDLPCLVAYSDTVQCQPSSKEMSQNS